MPILSRKKLPQNFYRFENYLLDNGDPTMKLTKQQLAKIIQEEISSFNEMEDPKEIGMAMLKNERREMYKAIIENLEHMIEKVKSIAQGDGDRLEEAGHMHHDTNSGRLMQQKAMDIIAAMQPEELAQLLQTPMMQMAFQRLMGMGKY